MTKLQAYAKQILSLIDLTSLNNNDNDASIINLCKKATTVYGNVPAICIYSHFVPLAKKLLDGTGIKIATVTNFPHGMQNIELALFETKLAITLGAEEVDIVFPYHALINSDTNIGSKMISGAKQICRNKILKVIIESGELHTPELIRTASQISINNGADFIKTSTGKVAINATLSATEIMLKVIKDSGENCGFKAAGGVRSVIEAIKYLELTTGIMDKAWVNSNNFRFGASGLLDDVIAVLANISNSSDSTY
ncbi:MAG: deoxyribose-phosphate aldolase [Burkholderiales bacterium]|nr:deoxyribose-phosphate aldolase [Burkholderiales bacterium]